MPARRRRSSAEPARQCGTTTRSERDANFRCWALRRSSRSRRAPHRYRAALLRVATRHGREDGGAKGRPGRQRAQSMSCRSTAASTSDTSSPLNTRCLSASRRPRRQTPRCRAPIDRLAARLLGAHYAAVPRIIPHESSRGVVSVGDIEAWRRTGRRLHRFREAEVEHLHRAVRADLMFAGFRSRWMIPCSAQLPVRQRSASRWASFIEKHCATCDACDRSSPSQVMTSAVRAAALRARRWQRCWMVEGGEDFRFTLKTGESIVTAASDGGRILIAELALQLGVGGG